MSIKLRYTVEQNLHEVGVWDNKQQRFVCNCCHRKDAVKIAGLLNKSKIKVK